MSDDDLGPADASSEPRPAQPITRRWHGPSLVWVVPIVALAVGASLIVRSLLQAGPNVTITFPTATGLHAGKTEVRYKDVAVGRVDAVSLSDDRKSVQVSVKLDRSAASIAVDDTRFWVVRPRVDTAGISGLETLFSGAYIGVDAGVSTKDRRRFTGLDAPPFVLRGEPGRSFVLRTEDLGSLDFGSPVLYRRTHVGRVVGYTLDPVKDELSVQIFIESPYDRLVNAQSRFWNASGVDLTLNSSGLTLNTQTLSSVLAGGIAIERPAGTQALPPAPDGSRFELAPDRKTALATPDGPPLRVRMVFDRSTRGLAVGASVDFIGVEIGTVRSIRLNYDRKHERFPVEVQADVYPFRLGAVREAMAEPSVEAASADPKLINRLIRNGLRAQARTGNLLTGQMYIALDFIPKAPPVTPNNDRTMVSIPTVPGTLSDIQPQIAEIVAKISKVPFDQIGQNVQDMLGDARAAIAKLTPEAQASLAEVRRTLGAVQASLERMDHNLLDPSAPIHRNTEQTMIDLQRAAQSLRVLTDYLQRHPESLLRGKPDDPSVPAPERTR